MLARSLARSNEALDRFTYASAHDLKAPLRGIGYVVEWLEEDLGPTLSESAKEKLTLLRSRVQRMAALIDGILDYSHAGKSPDKLKPVSVKALLEDVVDLLATLPGATIELAPDLPTFVTESGSLRQVFMNLIDNAFKHGRRDSAVHVRVSARDDGAFYEFAICDDGRGIAPEYHHRIWTLFQTLNARDRVDGAGIGLSIVKKIVEGHGGRAWVDSVPDQGATFRFTWPKGSPAVRPPATSPEGKEIRTPHQG
jgi:signal transduction histidine kinase